MNRYTRLKPGLLAEFIPKYLAENGPSQLRDIAAAVKRRVRREVSNITIQTVLQTLRSNGSVTQLRHGVYATGDMADATLLECLTAGDRAFEVAASFFFVKEDPFCLRHDFVRHLHRELPGLPPTEPDYIIRQLVKKGVLVEKPYSQFAKDPHKEGKGLGLAPEVWRDLLQSREEETPVYDTSGDEDTPDPMEYLLS